MSIYRKLEKNENLLPCPFCGSINLHIRVGDGYVDEYVECDKCNAEGPQAYLIKIGQHLVIDPIKAWNKRV